MEVSSFLLREESPLIVVVMMGISPRRGPGTDIHIYIYQY